MIKSHHELFFLYTIHDGPFGWPPQGFWNFGRGSVTIYIYIHVYIYIYLYLSISMSGTFAWANTCFSLRICQYICIHLLLTVWLLHFGWNNGFDKM